MAKSKSRLIKYMGSSDVRVLEKGETFDGRVRDGLPFDLVWDWSNHHVLDLKAVQVGVDEKGKPVTEELADELIQLLLEDNPSAFQDVSEAKVIPTNEAQRLWRGVGAAQPVISAQDASVPPGNNSTSAAGGSTVTTT